MENLLNKVQEAGYDVTSLVGEESIEFWHNMRETVASTTEEQVLCLMICAEHQATFDYHKQSIETLISALQLLKNADSPRADLMLSLRNSLSERYVATNQYDKALEEYITLTRLAIEFGDIDSYAMAILGMGKLCERFGDTSRAIRYYHKIDTVDHALSARSLRLHYKLHKLSCYIRLNKRKLAQKVLRECEELSILVSDKLLTGQMMLFQTRLYRQQGDINQALHVLATIPYAVGNFESSWFACMSRVEQAYCLLESNKPHVAIYLLTQAAKRAENAKLSSEVIISLYNAFSDIYQQQGLYSAALEYEKKAFTIESKMIQGIPIAELGANQLRRLSRFDLQLKLILSEMENRELKETTESQKHTVAQLQQDVFTDPLTQLHNRRWLDSCLKDLLIHEADFAFLIVDIDHFKSINDELSHLVGDKAIMNVSAQIRHLFDQPNHHCVRFGGEEFLVILENVDLKQAEDEAENLRLNIAQFDWQPVLGDRQLTVSIGVTLHRLGENTQRTFHRADKALYRAKANGRNQVCSE